MSVLTLQQAKDYLNITASTYDTELQGFIDAAEAAIAKRCGPLAPTAVTASHVDGYGCELVLPTSPAISLTSVTPNTGGPLTVSDLTVTPSGVVSYAVTGAYFPSPWYVVVYQAGRATVPNDLLLAVKELVRHLWTTQRGSGRTGPASDTQGGPGYLMPYRVLELMGPHTMPGFA